MTNIIYSPEYMPQEPFSCLFEIQLLPSYLIFSPDPLISGRDIAVLIITLLFDLLVYACDFTIFQDRSDIPNIFPIYIHPVINNDTSNNLPVLRGKALLFYPCLQLKSFILYYFVGFASKRSTLKFLCIICGESEVICITCEITLKDLRSRPVGCPDDGRSCWQCKGWWPHLAATPRLHCPDRLSAPA